MAVGCANTLIREIKSMSFTPSQIWAFVIALIGLSLTILNVIDKINLFIQRAQKPKEEQSKRIDNLESEVKDLKRYVSTDGDRIKELEQGNKVMLHSMSALLSHGIHGNNVEEMTKAKEELDRYLIER